MTDSNAAEQLDPSVLGEEVGDERRAAADFPPDQPMAVDDPSILADGTIAEDDVASREYRHVEGMQGEAPPPVGGLVETGADPDVLDAEQQLIADEGPDADRSPEASALHVED